MKIRCEYTCTLCGDVGSNCEGKENISCEHCGFTFGTQFCYDRHRRLNKNKLGSRCSSLKHCLECNATYRVANLKGQPHVCGRTSWWGELNENFSTYFSQVSPMHETHGYRSRMHVGRVHSRADTEENCTTKQFLVGFLRYRNISSTL